MFFRSIKLNRDFELDEGTQTVGRSPDCEIVLEPNQVSKRHLLVRRTGDLVEVKDEESRNNSRVNGLEIRERGWIKLKPNDMIDICGFDFRLLTDSGASGVSGACIVEAGEFQSDAGSLGSKAISLSNHDLDLTEQYTQLSALLAITKTLRDVLKTEDVLERAVSILFKILPGIDRAAICFINDDGEVQPKWWQVGEGDPHSTIRISQHIARHVAATSEAVITRDAKQDFENALSVQSGVMRSVMCCPLIDADNVVFGMIHVDSSVLAMFNESDLEILAAVALQIGLAINCSRLHATKMIDEIILSDMQRARDVQRRYLPSAPPKIEGFDLFGFYRAAREVGGDYYDYASLEDGRQAIILGDVVGKGVPAALTMVRLATEARAGLEFAKSPSELLTRLNRRLPDDFITLAVIMVDPATGRISLSNAGHEPPLLRKLDGSVSSVGFDFSGCPIGVLEDEVYQDTEFTLATGESLLVFSDGFPDAEQKSSDRRYGSERLAREFGKFDGTAAETIEHMVREVDRFTQGGRQFDDMCMVCLKRL